MKRFQDNDGVIYTLLQIMNLNESEELLTDEELDQLDTIEVGERVNVDMCEWLERIEYAERWCRNCGKDIVENEGWYHELDEFFRDAYHCDDCHDILYTKEEWSALYDEDPDEFYYTE